MANSSNVSTLKVSNAIRSLTVTKTRGLFFQLGVPLEKLDDIAEKYDGNNRKDHFVKEWLDMFPDASWEKLIAGLRMIKINSLADEIESEHISMPAATSSSLVSLTPTFARPEISTPGQLQTSATAGPMSVTPAPAYPLSPLEISSPPFSFITASFEQRVELVKDRIEHLEDEFTNIKSDARAHLCERERREQNFLKKFRDHLLELPCTRKQIHVRFFVRNEEGILKSDTIEKLFSILRPHCTYRNYELIFHIVKRFCKEMNKQMLSYRDSLIVFEKATTVDVYLCAIKAPPGGRITAGFMRMTMKINKPASECTLHEIRELKESIEQEADLESYAMYIDTPETGSVRVELCIPEEVGWMVGVVFTPDFRERHLLSVVIVKRDQGVLEEQSLIDYLVRE